MKYQWLEKQTATDLGDKLGCTVKSIKQGFLGEEPNTELGIEIELEGETPDIVDKLDSLLNMKRDGGRTLREAVESNLDLSLANPQKESYKLSQLYGLTHGQLDNHIDGISNLAEAKEFMRKLAHVTLWLVKQTKLDE